MPDSRASDPPLLDQLIALAWRAGEAILAVYQDPGPVTRKDNGSPLTQADRAAQAIIARGLRDLTPDIPQLSEEARIANPAERASWTCLWVIDPLDGTKEFLRRNDEFTVNIALVEAGSPVMGVVHAPALARTYAACPGQVFRRIGSSAAEPIHTRPIDPNKITLSVSRSHPSPALSALIESLHRQFAEVERLSVGSSLKICQVAEGTADLYPRLGPTSEWDTAAAQAILTTAGGRMIDLQGETLRYNKADILNPAFLCLGDRKADWQKWLPE